jgi:hypothetical protein
MNMHQQNELLRKTIDELKAVGVPVTGVYMPASDADGGIEIDGQYILQIAPYHDPMFLLDVVESPGEEIASFSNTSQLIKFLMET